MESFPNLKIGLKSHVSSIRISLTCSSILSLGLLKTTGLKSFTKKFGLSSHHVSKIGMVHFMCSYLNIFLFSCHYMVKQLTCVPCYKIKLLTNVSLDYEGMCSLYSSSWCDGSDDRTHSKEFFSSSWEAGLLSWLSLS